MYSYLRDLNRENSAINIGGTKIIEMLNKDNVKIRIEGNIEILHLDGFRISYIKSDERMKIL